MYMSVSTLIPDEGATSCLKARMDRSAPIGCRQLPARSGSNSLVCKRSVLTGRGDGICCLRHCRRVRRREFPVAAACVRALDTQERHGAPLANAAARRRRHESRPKTKRALQSGKGVLHNTHERPAGVLVSRLCRPMHWPSGLGCHSPPRRPGRRSRSCARPQAPPRRFPATCRWAPETPRVISGHRTAKRRPPHMHGAIVAVKVGVVQLRNTRAQGGSRA
jgi:hypothetical protein